MLRLDQAMGTQAEPINPMLPQSAKRQHIAFLEPISTPEDLERAIHLLCERLCIDLVQAHEGARRLDVLFHRTDGLVEALRIGTGAPTCDEKHLAKMFVEKLATVSPGFGIEAATLTAWMTERVVPRQMNAIGMREPDQYALSHLTDRLSNRLGTENIYRLASVESYVPERAIKKVSPTSVHQADWRHGLPRPIHLLSPPEPVDVTALMPDHPPKMFQWRGITHRIKRADGPERIQGEWWQSRNEIAETRDYFQVENERGERYWLYRDNRLSSSQTYRWYLHGVFA